MTDPQTTPRCDGWCKFANPVTHIGEKGYAYCTECAKDRRESGYESTRRLRGWELDLLKAGKTLPSYKPISAPVHQALGDIASRFPILPGVLADALDEHGSDALAWAWVDGTRLLRLEVDA